LATCSDEAPLSGVIVTPEPGDARPPEFFGSPVDPLEVCAEDKAEAIVVAI
jgi:hypothetical protein